MGCRCGLFSFNISYKAINTTKTLLIIYVTSLQSGNMRTGNLVLNGYTLALYAR